MISVAITVGPEQADIQGSDQRALQAAVDYIAGLGGGTVRVLPGVYLMQDSLHLRSGVRVVGSGPDTVLAKADAVASSLYLDGDYGEEALTLEDASGFEPGMGITAFDDTNTGFHTTVATILAKDGNTLVISKPLNGDYMVSQGAMAQTTFPVVSGYYINGAVIENLAIRGNKAHNPYLNGCRGAGIFLYRAQGCAIRDCLVHDYHGDGISFQQSDDTLVERCEVSGCTHLGLHPGSGSQRPVVRDCYAHDNGSDGLFLCWRVKHGRFERIRSSSNGGHGISIGHKDTDNLFRDCLVENNRQCGIYFRNESAPMAGHRNTFEDCRIVGNALAGVCVEGATRDITLRRCQVCGQPCGISIGIEAEDVHLEDVTFQGNTVDIRREHGDADGR